MPWLRHDGGGADAPWHPLAVADGTGPAARRPIDPATVEPATASPLRRSMPGRYGVRPLIVVVMPAYNAARTLERTYHDIPRDVGGLTRPDITKARKQRRPDQVVVADHRGPVRQHLGDPPELPAVQDLAM